MFGRSAAEADPPSTLKTENHRTNRRIAFIIETHWSSVVPAHTCCLHAARASRGSATFAGYRDVRSSFLPRSSPRWKGAPRAKASGLALLVHPGVAPSLGRIPLRPDVGREPSRLL